MRKQKKQLKLRQLFIFILSVGLLALQISCKDELAEVQNEEVFKEGMNNSSAARTDSGKQAILENPYAVKNMIRAYADLATNGDISRAEAISGIRASHLYVEFNVDQEKLDLLRADSTLVMYPYRLDIQISDKEDSRNNSDSDFSDKIQTYYASIPVSYELPITEYKVLEELYIPDEEKVDQNGKEIQSSVPEPNGVSVDDLVAKSLELTGNTDDAISGAPVAARSGKWRPGGRITMQDTELGTVGVEGLKIQARRWFTTHNGFVDSNGYYQCDGTFRNPANYSFDFERYEFEIRGSISGVDGPKMEGNWNQHYQRNSKQNYHSNIFRAAFHYAYKNILNLRRPPQNGFWRTQLKIQANYFNDPTGTSNGNHNPARRFLGMGSAIHMYAPTRPSDGLYGTTIHEMAHASHWNMDKNNYNNGDKIVLESWARGVQWALTRTVYPNYEPQYIRGSYTGAVQDLIDGMKIVQNGLFESNGNLETANAAYSDQVANYNIRQIEDALNGNRTWSGWRNKIFNSYNNLTKNNLNATFQYWQTR